MSHTKRLSKDVIALSTTLYAKPDPVLDTPDIASWGTDVISDPPTAFQHVFAGLDEATAYVIFIQAGGSPSNTDIALAPINALTEAITAAEPIAATLPTATQDSIDAIEAVAEQFVFTVPNQVDANALTGGGGGGAGTFTHEFTIRDNASNLLPNCEVILTLGAASSSASIHGSGNSDDNGLVTFRFDAGVYYLWRAKSGYNFDDNPRKITVDGVGGVTVSDP